MQNPKAFHGAGGHRAGASGWIAWANESRIVGTAQSAVVFGVPEDEGLDIIG
jgi:hypothetical protein